ncbi:hypothetical protein QZH41_018681, partial [Actinostola sp. cb2023]
NPKPSLIKKKARTTILNVLNKRQTQEKSFAPEKRSSPIQEQTWRPEQGTHRIGQQTTSVSPTYHTGQPLRTSQSRNTDHVTKDADRSPKWVQAGERRSSVSNLVRKWSTDNFTQGPRGESRPKAISFTSSGNQSAASRSCPKSISDPKRILSSSYPPSGKLDADENRYSVVIQSSTCYPPPLRRKSSADVTPHDVTVNAIRIYEATTKMVAADPDLLARLDRYPSREPPPVMSPTSVERFVWERDVNTGIEQKTRAVVLKGKSLTQGSHAVPNAELGTRPRLVSDSVQVSIPFGVPESPTSTRESTSESDGWSSSVSVCVPFQVTDNQHVRPLPVRGGMRPQSLAPTDGTLAIEALNELFDRSDEFGTSQPRRYVTTKLTHPSMASSDCTIEIPSRDVSSSPKLVTVRRRSEDEMVQKIVHFDDSLLRNECPSEVFDNEDGIGMSKHGKYSLVDQNYNTATSEAKNKSSSLTRTQQQPQSDSSSPKIRPRATLVNSKTPYRSSSLVTARSRRSHVTVRSRHGHGAVTSRYGHGTVTAQSRHGTVTAQSRHGTVTARSRRSHVTVRSRHGHGAVTSRYGHGTVTAQSRHGTVTAQSRHGTVTVTAQSRYGHGHGAVTSRYGHGTVTAQSRHVLQKQRQQVYQQQVSVITSIPSLPPPVFSFGGRAVSTKDKDEVEMLRARIRQLESELELEKAKHAPNDAILSSIPILEKEKLRLQAQINEALQDLGKAKSQLRTATYTTNRLDAEKDVVETKYKKLEKDFEKLKAQNVELEFERDKLLREHKNQTNENDKDMDANLVTIQSLSQRNDELVQSEYELKEQVCVLVQGLQDVRESVLKVKEENGLLHYEIVDNGVAMAECMNKCLLGLQQIVDRMNNESANKRVSIVSNASEYEEEIERLTEELADSKSCMHALLQRVVELESTSVSSEATTDKEVNYDGCPGCMKLREELKKLQMDYDEQKEKIEKMEAEMEDLSTEKDDLHQEAKYLKKVLSYREDVMEVQVSQKTTRQLQRLETNLEEAEKKCNDLENEVGVLYKQKQSLLVNMMKLHDEEVAQQNGDGDDDDDDDDDDHSDDDDDDYDDYSSDEQTPRTTPPRSKTGSLKKSLYANISNEAEFSSGASFYGSDTESESESDEWSDLEESPRRVRDLVSGLKSERKRMKSNIKELMTDKRNLNKRIDKSTQDFKSLMKRMQNLDSDNKSLRDKVKTERRALKSKVKKEERESERLRESFKEMESEKAALIKCIEMNSAANELETKEPTEDLDMDDMTRLIAKAQAFAQEERENKDEDVIEEESEVDEEGESGEEKDNEEEDSGAKDDPESDEKSSSSSEEEEKQENKNTQETSSPSLQVNESKSASEEEQEDKDKEEEDRERYEMEDIMSPPPPPQARLLQRRASTVGINMDRVNREKQHLEDEVASLKKYLNRSAYRRRYSTVESPKAPMPLGAMKTLESLLQKSDLELQEANAKICRLQSIDADLEERLKDAEVNQDELRRAVVIANNYAAEEREKNSGLEENRDTLLQKLEVLKRENSRLRKSRAINAVYRKGVRSVKSLTTSEEDLVDSDGADAGSDISSLTSCRSSIASDL